MKLKKLKKRYSELKDLPLKVKNLFYTLDQGED